MNPRHHPQNPPPFELHRDRYGIPHQRASTETALAYAQGHVTALDRADQIETGRRRAHARLAAHHGPDAATWDRFAVRVRLADTARRVHDALAPPERDWLAAYTRGVNDALGGHSWRPWTPIGVFLVDHVLFNGFPATLWRDHIARTLGPRLPGTPPETICGWLTADGGPGAGNDSGSNAWAVTPALTTSGSPLLAGDPHRNLELPGPYQQIRLACTDPADPYDVLGLAFPGVPGLQHFGHALSDGGTTDTHTGVAWGITNAMAHHVEVFAERLRRTPGDTWEAHGPDGWEPTTWGRETIEIRTATSTRHETVPWIETPRGPRVATRAPDPTGPEVGHDPVHFTIRWPVRVLADVGVATWRRLLRSRTAQDVAAAFRDGWIDPVNRVLTADSGGTILSLTAGRLAHRAPAERALPVPAWTDAARDRPWHTLPAPEHVTTGVAVDANERPTTSTTTPDHRRGREEHGLGWSYAPYRADRIRQLLSAPPAGGENPDTQRRIHADVSSGAALALLDHVGTPAELRHWADAGAPMDADSAAAATFSRWRDDLVRQAAADPRLAALRTDPARYGEIFAPWFDPAASIGHGLLRVLRELRPSVDPATARATATTTPGITWGDLHTLAPFRHHGTPGTNFGPTPVSGDNDTVHCTGGTPGVSPLGTRGSVARWIWDLSDRRNDRWNVPFGADGRPGRPHATDQHHTWADGGTVPVETRWDHLTAVDLDIHPLERIGR